MSAAGPSKVSRKSASRLPPDERLSVILTAARAVLAAKGYENTLLSDIAREAGIVEGTIYRHFENKRDLFVKVAEIWFTEKLSEDSHVRAVPGTHNKLRHLALHTLSIITSEPVLSRFMLLDLRPDPSYRSTPFYHLNRRFTQEVVDVCQEAIDRGEFLPNVPVRLLRDMFFGCIEHSTWAFLRGEGKLSVEEVANGIADVVYRGMVTQAPAPTDAISARLARIEETLAKAPWLADSSRDQS